MINKNDIRTLINSHSDEFTVHHFYQEACEFVVAVSKMELWGVGSVEEHTVLKNNLIEELVDMQIMIEIAKEFYGIRDDEFRLEIMNKMEENLKRCGNV